MRPGSLAPLQGPELPLWPPILASVGPGSRSVAHAHHAMHLVLALEGRVAVTLDDGRVRRACGVLTAPDVPHAIDGAGVTTLLVFLDPESEVGAALLASMRAPVRLLSRQERDRLVADGVDALRLMTADGVEWVRRTAALLGGAGLRARRPVHPRVRKALRLLREDPSRAASLRALAADVGLSEGRLMHAFTESIGIPLRPYVLWLRLQRAASAIVTGQSVSEAAAWAGFSDAAHLSRSFKRAFGMTPSMLVPARASQLVQARRRSSAVSHRA
ncbi:MAG: AraC family transcriptional regulator [Myxococcota bacterium]